MTTFTITIEDEIVEMYGHSRIEKYLSNLSSSLSNQLEVDEVLSELQTLDMALQTEPMWQQARETLGRRSASLI
jgi:hypothetical protein